MPVLMLALMGDVAWAEDAKTKQNQDVAKSIENILQKASEQGFVDLKTPNEEPDPSAETEPVSEASEIFIEQLSAHPQGGVSCEIAELLDLKEQTAVASYNDIAIAKSKMASVDALDDRIPLIKTYWSLGLGTEARALVQPFNGRRAPLLISVSDVLAGDINESGKSVLKQYASCNEHANLWYKAALAGTNSKTPKEAKVLPDSKDLEVLEQMPSEIRGILTRRLGVFAAEDGDLHLANKMLLSIEPDAKNGKFPNSRDDEMMYLFALVDQSKNGQKGIKILERLSKSDGPLRTRSIFQLSDKFSVDGKYPYPGFSEDLQSVSQQYRGKSESRMASLETIKLHLKKGAATESIKLTKRELGAADPERVAVVTMIADHILTGLNDEKNSARIGALNAYLFDSGFFTPLETHAELKHAALIAALDLHLPELEKQIYSDGDANNLDKNGLKLLTLAKAKAARKNGNIELLKEISSENKNDPELSSLLVQSLVEAGRTKDALKIVKALPHGEDRYAKLADLEWQAGDFKSAHSNLQSLDYASGGSLDNKKLQLAGLITSAETIYSNMIVPNSPEDLGELKSDIAHDINITKAYLTGG